MSDVLDEDSAEIAFAALGLKVDGLSVQLARLEKLCRRQAVDYAPTLAKVSEDIWKLKEATAALGTSPALKLSNEQFRQESEHVRARIRADMERDLQASRAELQAAAREVRSSLKSARTKRKQDWSLLQVGGACWAVGVVMWIGFSGPVARALPADWAIPAKMAAKTMGTDRWTAAERMMASAKPADWKILLQAAALLRNNQAALAACERQADQASKALRCSVRVAPSDRAP